MHSTLAVVVAVGSIFVAAADDACEDVRADQNIAGSAALLQVASKVGDAPEQDKAEVKSVIADTAKAPEATQKQEVKVSASTASKNDSKVVLLAESLVSSEDRPGKRKVHRRTSFVAAENTHRDKAKGKQSTKGYPEEFADEWKTIMVWGSIVLPLFFLACGSPFGPAELGTVDSGMSHAEALKKSGGQ